MSLQSEFFKSCASNDLDRVVQLHKDVDIHALDDVAMTALHHAACAGALEVARYLVNLGAILDAQDEDDWTPYMYAVFKEHFEVAFFLASSGAQTQNSYRVDYVEDVEIKTPYGMEKELRRAMGADRLQAWLDYQKSQEQALSLDKNALPAPGTKFRRTL